MSGPGLDRRSHTDYTVACICPMGVELAPVVAMLDREHEQLPLRRDQNAYTLGEIGKHNVVVAVMPETGTNAAAIVATQILSDFPSIRFGSLVGVGGGVPGRLDVRLGDVVVSQPSDTFGGVVQYDFGKKVQSSGAKFQRTGLLNKPPQVLCANVRKLQAQHLQKGSQMGVYLSEMLERFPAMQALYTAPTTMPDLLFDNTYQHLSGSTCNQCDQRRSIERAARLDGEPHVHYGTIGSANVVVKDAVVRDELREDMDILCVEMEAAGIMNSFPSLVIRGICDYADSHKNTAWQPYAAATASAYMKELLVTIPPQQVSQAPYALHSTASEPATSPRNIAIDASGLHRPSQPLNDPIDQTAALYNALHYEGMNDRAAQLDLPMLPIESFEWVWSTTFKTWLGQPTAFYWITGKPGSGKSTLMRYLVKARRTKEYLQENVDNYTILSFFFDYRAGASAANNEYGLLKQLIFQLCDRFSDVEDKMKRRNVQKFMSDAGLHRLLDIFCDIVEDLPSPVCIFVDGLDEYTRGYADLVHLLTDIRNRTHVKICFASRPEPVFQRLFNDLPRLAMQEHNASSIRIYIDHAILRARDAIIDVDAAFDDSLRRAILERAIGVIIWARLAVDELIRALCSQQSRSVLMATLDQLPDDLEQMYDRALVRIPSRQIAEAASLLTFLNAAGGKVNLKMLHGIWSFLKLDIPDETMTHNHVDIKSFLARLQRLLGSFIDVNVWPQHPESEIAPSMYGKAPGYLWDGTDRVVEVRLMHMTLQPYLERSTVVQRHICPRVRHQYPDRMMLRLYANVISTVSAEQSQFAYQKVSSQGVTIGYTHAEFRNPHLLYNLLTDVAAVDVTWITQLELLIRSVCAIVDEAIRSSVAVHDTYGICKQALQSPILYLGGFRVPEWKSFSSISFPSRDCLRLQSAIRSMIPDWIIGAVSDELYNETSRCVSAPAVCNGLLAISVVSLLDFAKEPLFFGSHQKSDPWVHLLVKYANSIIDMVRPNGIALEVLMLEHLLWSAGPGLYNHHILVCTLVYNLLQSMKDLRCEQEISSDEYCDCKSGNHNLQRSMTWDWFVFPGSQERWENTCIMWFKKFAVKKIIGKERSINGYCKRNGTALHVLMAQQELWSSFPDAPKCLAKLIILAKLGADPSIRHQRKTPLQVLQPKELKNLFRRPKIEKPTATAIEILKHHKKYGIWPDFAELVRDQHLTYLEHLTHWKTDDSGHLILDDLTEVPPFEMG